MGSRKEEFSITIPSVGMNAASCGGRWCRRKAAVFATELNIALKNRSFGW